LHEKEITVREDIKSLTGERYDYIVQRAMEVLGHDYPQLFEAEDPIEELYKLAREKAPYAKWKAASNPEPEVSRKKSDSSLQDEEQEEE